MLKPLLLQQKKFNLQYHLLFGWKEPTLKRHEQFLKQHNQNCQPCKLQPILKTPLRKLHLLLLRLVLDAHPVRHWRHGTEFRGCRGSINRRSGGGNVRQAIFAGWHSDRWSTWPVDLEWCLPSTWNWKPRITSWRVSRNLPIDPCKKPAILERYIGQTDRPTDGQRFTHFLSGTPV